MPRKSDNEIQGFSVYLRRDIAVSNLVAQREDLSDMIKILLLDFTNCNQVLNDGNRINFIDGLITLSKKDTRHSLKDGARQQ